MEGKVNFYFSLRNYSAHLPVMIGDFLIEEANRSYFFPMSSLQSLLRSFEENRLGAVKVSNHTIINSLHFGLFCYLFLVNGDGVSLHVVWHSRGCANGVRENALRFIMQTLVQSTTDHYINWE